MKQSKLVLATGISMLACIASAAPTYAAPAASTAVQGIILRSDKDGNSELYSIDPATHASVRLTNNLAEDMDGSWSPDGGFVVFSSNRGDGRHFQLYTLNYATKAVTQLTTVPNANFVTPVWSPDGSTIAFVSQYDSDATSGISTMHSDGTGIKEVTRSKTFQLQYPAWSPDGSNLLTIGFGGGSAPDVYRLTLTTGKLQLLAHNGFPAVYSPDGTQIAFSRRDTNFVQQVVLMKADGTQQQQMTHDPQVSRWVADWSPDGKQLLLNELVGNPANDNVQDIGVRTLSLESSVETNIATNATLPGFTYFSSEGSWR